MVDTRRRCRGRCRLKLLRQRHANPRSQGGDDVPQTCTLSTLLDCAPSLIPWHPKNRAILLLFEAPVVLPSIVRYNDDRTNTAKPCRQGWSKGGAAVPRTCMLISPLDRVPSLIPWHPKNRAVLLLFEAPVVRPIIEHSRIFFYQISINLHRKVCNLI